MYVLYMNVCMFLELMIYFMFLHSCPVPLGLPPPSLTYHYEDKRGFLGEEIVIESPVLTGNITWLVLQTDVIRLLQTNFISI